MASLISVDPTRAYACGFPIGGATAAVIINCRRAATPEALTAALGEAVQGLAVTLAGLRRGGSVKERSESTEASVGPFTAGAYDPQSVDLAMITYREGPGWTLADCAPNFGPHPVAVVLEPDVPGWQYACSPAGIAGAVEALAPLLTVPA